MDVSSSGGAPVNSRWSPTKEQISMLESFYSQGIRAPSTEMIEQIASRLKAYGHIEGKNVFYWFQNHKARQRQKQKQENMAYINKYLHKAHQPVFAPPCRNVVNSPCYLPKSDVMGLCQQHQNMLLPGNFKRRSRSETVSYAFKGYDQEAVLREHHNHTTKNKFERSPVTIDKSSSDLETLPLFPLHPTGILEGASTIYSHGSINTPISSEITHGIGEHSAADHKPFFDFFSEKDPFESCH
ncbi:hypothetical protein D5086_002151 [Populus alba]|uniref:Uncharacterized protein n=3 Tax=Populus TaxID=3689 RepID=A0ACC4D0Q5_POPAL|nr:WUSCHEL-related homeobox 2-like [Populus alba]KAJ7012574.1 WUSCHEL-related homeobox 2-like [Populus alba x Populus x berolinensis]TKS01499.1 WOX2a [Populus alba]